MNKIQRLPKLLTGLKAATISSLFCLLSFNPSASGTDSSSSLLEKLFYKDFSVGDLNIVEEELYKS